MLNHSMPFVRAVLATAAVAICTTLVSVQGAEPDSKVLAFKLPDQIQWTESPSGAKQAVLLGNPSKPGLYIIAVKWTPHHMSHPHFHPNTRYVTVISGTWWVGTGSKYDPDSTTAMPAGSFVTHFGKQIHYDGAKDEEVTLQIVGEGPETSTPASTK